MSIALKRSLCIALCLALPACGTEVEEEVLTEEQEGPLAEHEGLAVEPLSFASLDLGARIAGSERTFELVGPGGAGGTVAAYVACPAGIEPCDHEGLEEGVLYTYVLEVVPAGGASVFRTNAGIAEHVEGAGFDLDQAGAALGSGTRLVVTCNDGALVWAASGGEDWSAGAPITLFWQSTRPPVEVEQGYELVAEGNLATSAGLYPEGGTSSECF